MLSTYKDGLLAAMYCCLSDQSFSEGLGTIASITQIVERPQPLFESLTSVMENEMNDYFLLADNRLSVPHVRPRMDRSRGTCYSCAL